MNAAVPVCLIFSADRPWARRIAARLRSDLETTVTADRRRVLRAAARGEAVLVMDLLTTGALPLLERVRRQYPALPVVACGTPRTAPFLAALQQGTFAVLEREADPATIASVARSAAGTARPAAHAPRTVPAGTDTASAPAPLAPPPLPGPPPPPEADTLSGYLDSSLRSLTAHYGVLRACLFLLDSGGESFAPAASLNCPPEIQEWRLAADDQFVRYLERCAATLALPEAPADLAAHFARAGAELLVPLLSDRGLIGWAWFSRPADGTPWSPEKRRHLAAALDHLARSVEAARRADRRRAAVLALEILGGALGAGVAVADRDGRLVFINEQTPSLLGLTPPPDAGDRVETLGAVAADLLHRALEGEGEQRRLTPPGRDTALLLQSFPYLYRHQRLAVLVIRELMPLPAQAAEPAAPPPDEDRLWEQVADGLAHQIRNPLVAIKTFAQLLPEKYKDPDFRQEFGTMVNREIDRLTGLLNSIAALGRPLQLRRHAVDIHTVIKRGLNTALVRHPDSPMKKIEVEVPDHLPRIAADEEVLAEAFAQLFANAIEAASRRRTPRLRITAQVTAAGDQPRLTVTIEDNGPGIPEEMRPFIFSPFCTTKAHGLGFGLCIARRAIRAHGGELEIVSRPSGTRVFVQLPFAVPGAFSGRTATQEEKRDETPADSG